MTAYEMRISDWSSDVCSSDLTETTFRIVAPAELAGMTPDKLRPWIEAQGAPTQEAARLLRWANMIANGRLIPIEKQSDARTDESLVGKECVSTCRSRGSLYLEK